MAVQPGQFRLSESATHSSAPRCSNRRRCATRSLNSLLDCRSRTNLVARCTVTKKVPESAPLRETRFAATGDRSTCDSSQTPIRRHRDHPFAPGLGGDATRSNHLIKLSSVEDDGLGEELQIIWELEPGTSVQEKSSLPDPNTFVERSKCVTGGAGALSSQRMSRIDTLALTASEAKLSTCNRPKRVCQFEAFGPGIARNVLIR